MVPFLMKLVLQITTFDMLLYLDNIDERFKYSNNNRPRAFSIRDINGSIWFHIQKK